MSVQSDRFCQMSCKVTEYILKIINSLLLSLSLINLINPDIFQLGTIIHVIPLLFVGI